MSPPTDPASAPAAETDGRRLRRDRNRDAVVDALLTLYDEGNLEPSSDQIAARSGVSARSLFRYFDDVDDLCQAAIQRQQQRVRHLVTINVERNASVQERVEALVHQRTSLFEAIGPVATVSRLRAPFQAVVADRLTRTRHSLRDQLGELFAEELSALPTPVAASRLAAADVVSSFEAWRLLRDDQRLSRSAASAVMADAVLTLISTLPTTGGPR
ncbi:MAG: TetR/AcrR family transcriptional regulator [Actinomycetota bacterium]